MELRHFKTSEFDSPDVPGSWVNMNEEFMKLLDDIRDDAGIPFQINSGFRTAKQNALDKGKINSAHLRGLAVDIAAPTSRQKFIIVETALKHGICRIGVGGNFVHLDADDSLPQDVIWTY